MQNEFDMGRKRKFYKGALNHVYQRTVGGVHLFYTVEDCLVFYSIFSVCARSSGIKALELCIMHNHVHILIDTENVHELYSFMDRVSAWFVRAYNCMHGRKGKLLKKSFGSAPKWEEKKKRSAAIYVGNNPVEKRFCRYAEEYRWNFLAYFKSDHPFSEAIKSTEASQNLKKFIKIVDNLIDLNLPLRYSLLHSFRSKLNAKEFEQLVDHAISGYLPFDYDALFSLFKSHDDMIVAMRSTTGDEFDIKEARDDFSLAFFREMMGYMQSHHSDDFVAKMISLPLEDKFRIVSELQANTNASSHQICQFLHIPVELSGPEIDLPVVER